MDEKKRSLYDKTGKIADESSDCSDDEHASSTYRQYARNNDQWESFFYSVFNEMVSAKATHDEDAQYYRGSSKEERDVIEYYNICKGDWTKVVDCITFGSGGDVERWKCDIIKPALLRGDVKDFGTNTKAAGSKTKAVSLDDSFSSEDDIPAGQSGNSKPQAKRKQVTLDDSSSDEDIRTYASCKRLQKRRDPTKSAPKAAAADTFMSKRDKLEYRMAKKRKDKKAKELEVAELFQSRDWGGSFSLDGHLKKRKNPGSLRNQMLDSIEQKYAKSGSKSKRKK